MTYHRRLGHINLNRVAKAVDWKLSLPTNVFCEGCLFGKSHRLPFTKDPKKRETVPGALIHADLCGPMEIKSLGGSNYFLLNKDDNTNYQFVYFIASKSSVLEKFKQFLQDWRKVTGGKYTIQSIRTDNGTEFVNAQMDQWLLSKGIRHETSLPYTPEQNGFIERSMRTVQESARSMIHGSGMKTFLWAEAIHTAVYCLNRVPSVNSDLSPFEIITGKKPDLSSLREFGSKAYAHIRDDARKKWDPKSRCLHLVGYNEGTRSYRLYDPSKGSIINTRDVTIVECSVAQSTIPIKEMNQESEGDINEQIDHTPSEQCDGVKTRTQTGSNKNVHVNYRDARQYNKRTNERNARCNDENQTDSLMATLLYAFICLDDPKTYQEAICSRESEQWQQAMAEEMSALKHCETWSLVPRTSGMNVVKNRWIFKKKTGTDGTIQRYKARLVAKGYSQQEGVDYLETFSPVARFDTVRVLMSVLASNPSMTIDQFDIKTAFLNGNLDETIFMEQPEGFEVNGDLVCKLNRSLYGLKQAPRTWNKRLESVLKEVGLKVSTSDPCLFISPNKDLFLVIYVDDGLVIGSNQELKLKLLESLKSNFDITFGDSSCFIGLQIKRERGSIFIHQSSYATRVLERFNMLDCSPVGTPSESHIVLELSEKKEPDQHYNYRELIGCLMFLAIVSRPDLAYSVNKLSQFMTHYQKEHWTAGLRVLKYLKGTLNHGILYNGKDCILTAYSDADYAGDKVTRRSRTGTVLTVSNGPVVWTSVRQKSTTLSSCESEFLAACTATTQVIWTSRLLEELGHGSNGPIILWIDNQSAIRLIKNPEFHQRLKHVDVQTKFIREKYQENFIEPNYIKTTEQLADIFTKALNGPTFSNLLVKLNVTQL